MITHGGELVSKESKRQAKKLYQIEYDKHNWSWLLDSNKSNVPPAVPRDEPSTKVQWVVFQCRLEGDW